jgi:hypothetical protein
MELLHAGSVRHIENPLLAFAVHRRSTNPRGALSNLLHEINAVPQLFLHLPHARLQVQAEEGLKPSEDLTFDICIVSRC